MHLKELKQRAPADLVAMAEEYEVEGASTMRRQDLMFAILKEVAEDGEEILGIAEVRDVFRSPKFGAIAGCMVIEGTVYRSRPIRVLRDNVVIYQGELESLRRFKDDASEVRNGMECGIGVKNYNDVKPGDLIEVYEVKEFARTL